MVFFTKKKQNNRHKNLPHVAMASLPENSLFGEKKNNNNYNKNKVRNKRNVFFFYCYHCYYFIFSPKGEFSVSWTNRSRHFLSHNGWFCFGTMTQIKSVFILVNVVFTSNKRKRKALSSIYLFFCNGRRSKCSFYKYEF